MDPTIVGIGCGLLTVGILLYVMWKLVWKPMIVWNREMDAESDRLNRLLHEEDER